MRRLLVLLAAAAALPAWASCREAGERLYQPEPPRADVERTFQLCLPLAQAGDPEAQYYLASAYMFRHPGGAPDEASVEKWMARSAHGGYGKAQFYLGTAYRLKGERARALELYEKAARNGVVPAMSALVELYGEGGAKDTQKAQYWRDELRARSSAKGTR